MTSLDEIAERLELLALANQARRRPVPLRSTQTDNRAARAAALVRERHDRIARAQALRVDRVVDLRGTYRTPKRADAPVPRADGPDEPRHLGSIAV